MYGKISAFIKQGEATLRPGFLYSDIPASLGRVSEIAGT